MCFLAIFRRPGKAPLYLEGENPETMSEAAGMGIELQAGGARLAYIPGAAAVTAAMRERLALADVVFFDGSLFSDDEMIATKAGSKTGCRRRRMTQQAVFEALEFKCDVLWPSMLDALHHAYVTPRHIPPGAFVPNE